MRGGSIEEQIVGEVRRLRRFALLLTRNADAADDLVQDTILRALHARHQFVEGTNIGAWLSTIMRNHYLSAARRNGRVLDDPDGLTTARMKAQDDPAAAYEAKDAISFVILLPAEQRRALMLAADGLSHEEIAEREHAAVGTIKSRIHRGRDRLAKLIGEPWRSPSSVGVLA